MKKTLLVFLFLVIAKFASAQAVVVNEYFNAFGQKAEFIELLVIENGTDLRNFTVRDFSSGGNPQQPLRFVNNPYWANLKAGTLIAITGDTSAYTQDTSKSDFSILIKYVPSDSTYIAGNLFNIANASDAIEIRMGETHVHGASHGTGNATSLPAPKAHYANDLMGGGTATPIAGASIKFTKLTPMTLADFGVDGNLVKDTTTSTPGQPNDLTGNLAYILLLRGTSGIVNNSTVPEGFKLGQNYPNPFNPVTNIRFSIPSSGFASVKVFDMTGKEVSTLINGNLTSGVYTVDFNGATLTSGVYFYRLDFTSSNNQFFSETKKLMLVK